MDHPEGHTGAGLMLTCGRGTKKNVKEGLRLIRRAMDQKCPKAYTAMADLYQEGVAVPQDVKKAEQLRHKAEKIEASRQDSQFH